MSLQLETPEQNSIQAYDKNKIKINSIDYHYNLIISEKDIIPWDISTLTSINAETIKPCLMFNPDLILIGHDTAKRLPQELICTLAKDKIGIEIMAVGAACRTFNILLSEFRAVVLGIIF